MEVDRGGHRLVLSAPAVRELARFALGRERVRDAMLSIAFVSTRAMAAMNRRHLGHHGPTDVITCALDRPTPRSPLVGDIYVAPDGVRAQARRLGVPLREELARVVIHGVLHAIGHDHPETEARSASPMWRRQNGCRPPPARRDCCESGCRPRRGRGSVGLIVSPPMGRCCPSIPRNGWPRRWWRSARGASAYARWLRARPRPARRRDRRRDPAARANASGWVTVLATIASAVVLVGVSESVARSVGDTRAVAAARDWRRLSPCWNVCSPPL